MLKVPSSWEKPNYDYLERGFYLFDGYQCLTAEDAKRVIKNQYICDTIRINLLDRIDSIQNFEE